jgi:hypothetical protein
LIDHAPADHIYLVLLREVFEEDVIGVIDDFLTVLHLVDPGLLGLSHGVEGLYPRRRGREPLVKLLAPAEVVVAIDIVHFVPIVPVDPVAH